MCRKSVGSSDREKLKCPNTGSESNTCFLSRRNCVTCRVKSNGDVYIRMQSNGIPSHCYGSSYDEDVAYPEDQNVDWEVKWNSDVSTVYNYDSVFESATIVERLLCDYDRLKSTHMFEDQYYFSRGENQDHVAGYAFDNLPIFNALTVDDHTDSEEEHACVSGQTCTIDYQDALKEEADTMDTCLTHSSLDKELHYHSLGRCMKDFNTLLSGTGSPTLCKDEPACLQDPFTYAKMAPAYQVNRGLTDIGLARDGHVIKGPYNADGELWSCAEHDICNGVFLEDGSYAYVATSTFPYIVGCWGPGTQQLKPVPTACSTNGCGYEYGDAGWSVPNWSDTATYGAPGAAIAITTTISSIAAMTAILI